MALTEPLTYDDNCSCASNTNCVTEAGFFSPNSPRIIPIKGFKMGCTPTESFLSSTLECLYDISCINLVQEQIDYNPSTNTTYIPVDVLKNSSQYPPETTILNLVNHLFIENWTTAINYSAYFDLCSPASCSYTYVQQFNSLYTVTFILGLYGGLNVVLKWMCPTIIYLLFKVYQYRKERSSLIQPSLNVEIATIKFASVASCPTNVPDAIVDPKSVATVSTPKCIAFLALSFISTTSYLYYRPVFGLLLQRSLFVGFCVLILVATICAGPLVYLSRQGKSDTLQASTILFF